MIENEYVQALLYSIQRKMWMPNMNYKQTKQQCMYKTIHSLKVEQWRTGKVKSTIII